MLRRLIPFPTEHGQQLDNSKFDGSKVFHISFQLALPNRHAERLEIVNYLDVPAHSRTA